MQGDAVSVIMALSSHDRGHKAASENWLQEKALGGHGFSRAAKAAKDAGFSP